MNAAFVFEQSGFHAEQVVVLRLFKFRIKAFEQEFASLQIVVRIILIGDRHGEHVDIQQIANKTAVALEREHFQEALLSEIVGVFCAAFALGYPHAFVLLGDGIVYIGRQLMRGFQSLGALDVALHDEALVELDEVGDPIKDKQVAAYGHFRGPEAVGQQAEIEERSVEYDVAVIRKIGINLSGVDVLYAVACDTVGSLGLQHFKERDHNLHLKFRLILNRPQAVGELRVIHIRYREPYGMLKSGFEHQPAHFRRKIAIVNRSYIAEIVSFAHIII